MSDLREAIVDKFEGEVAQGLRRDVSEREVDDLVALAEKVFEDRLAPLRKAFSLYKTTSWSDATPEVVIAARNLLNS